MEYDSGKRAKESSVRDRRYSIRYPFCSRRGDAGIEIRESRERGDLRSFSKRMFCVYAPHLGRRCPRPRNAPHEGQQVKMFAVVRVVRLGVGMGLEFLDIDPGSNAALLGWIENLRKSR